MKRLLFRSLLIIFSVFLLLSVNVVKADELDDITRGIKELVELRRLSEQATTPLEKEVSGLDTRIKNARNGITNAKKQIEKLTQNIDQREEDLAVSYIILSKRIAASYKRARLNSPLMTFLSTQNASKMTKDLMYRSSIEAQDNRLISEIGYEIESLELDSVKLEENQVRLAALEKQLNEQADFFREEINKAKDYQQDLSKKIADLTARQQEIINTRSGTFTASIGNSELADDYYASIKGFREEASSGRFAVFSFGAYTHRKGMSQYGARGRAKSGQNYKQILQAYYGKEPVNKDTGGSISVSGYGNLDFESTYLYGIAEMPSSWDLEALKAQAIAARTYAYRYKVEGKTICITEACQVFNKSKSDNVPSSWRQAVNDTKGQVLEDVVTFYASTHGVFASPIGWDTSDGNGGSNFIDKSYEKIGNSPWLYKAWYTKKYSVSSDKCGRSNPWLTGEELADIINASRFRDDRVTPITTSCWGGSPYSHEELRAKSDGPSKVIGVNVIQGNGSTSKIIFQTDKGEITISGSDFKTAFNLRAPGYLSIPQSRFSFFNIEHKQ